jgi:hypothetical protein
MPSPRPRGAPRRPTPSLRPLPAVLALAGLATGCARDSYDKVPTIAARYCTVTVNDPRTNVLLRCGPSCGGGQTPEEGRCEVYHSVLICYADDKVSSIRRLGPNGDVLPWCGWDRPAPAAPDAGTPARP